MAVSLWLASLRVLGTDIPDLHLFIAGSFDFPLSMLPLMFSFINAIAPKTEVASDWIS